MKLVEVTVQGTMSMLVSRPTAEALGGGNGTRNTLVTHKTPREEAEAVVYRRPNGECYFPGTWIFDLLRDQASNHKMKGSRKSAKYLVPAAVRVLVDDISIVDPETKKVVKEFEVDSRPVTIPATKGKIMRHRPRFDKWSASFQIRVNEDLLPVDFVHKLLTEGGDQNGLGDFRPQKSGPFGTFRVMSWEESNGTSA